MVAKNSILRSLYVNKYISYFRRAKWHGEVALKVLYLENPSIDEKNDFKYKVGGVDKYFTKLETFLKAVTQLKNNFHQIKLTLIHSFVEHWRYVLIYTYLLNNWQKIRKDNFFRLIFDFFNSITVAFLSLKSNANISKCNCLRKTCRFILGSSFAANQTWKFNIIYGCLYGPTHPSYSLYVSIFFC